MSSIFLAVQFEFTHAIGPHAGRYVVAHPSSVDDDGAALRTDDVDKRARLTGVRMKASSADVLAITVLAARARWQGLRRRAKEAALDDAPAEVPILRATFIRATEPLTREVADARLLEIGTSEEAQDAWIDDGLAVLNRAIRAYRAGARDPYVTEVARRDTRVTRLGYGTTEGLPDGIFLRAAVLPPPLGVKPTREERLVPSETTADVLAGRANVLEGEDLLLRAYLDLDHGRTRAAALQLRAAIHLLELELGEVLEGDEVRVDFAELAERTDGIVAAAAAGGLGESELAEVEEMVDRVEHALELWRYTPTLNQG